MWVLLASLGCSCVPVHDKRGYFTSLLEALHLSSSFFSISSSVCGGKDKAILSDFSSVLIMLILHSIKNMFFNFLCGYDSYFYCELCMDVCTWLRGIFVQGGDMVVNVDPMKITVVI